MVKVIIINGMGGSGKDTFVKLCESVVSPSKVHVCSVSMADKAKEIAMKLGWKPENKSDSDRKFLSSIKDAIDEWHDLSYTMVRNYIINTSSSPHSDIDTIVFVHSREPEDIDRLVREFNGTTVLIENHRVPIITTNHADAGVYDYSYDYYINNDNDIDELKESAKVFMDEILREK